MVGLTGLEKFSHLEDKIYRTIELTKTLRQEKEALEREVAVVKRELGALLDETAGRAWAAGRGGRDGERRQVLGRGGRPTTERGRVARSGPAPSRHGGGPAAGA